MHNIHRRTPAAESRSNEVVGQYPGNLLKKRFWTIQFLVNLKKNTRTPKVAVSVNDNLNK